MPTWKDNLHKLFKEPPDQAIQETIIKLMQSDVDDRATALTCAALADAGLMVGIGFHTPNADINKLFWDRRALYPTFSHRIKRACHLRIIGPQTENNLEVIREVRNVFAHAMINLSFARAEVETACNEIRLDDNSMFFVNRSERKSRYLYCYACNVTFRGVLGHVGVHWATGLGVPRLRSPILP